MNTPDMQIIAAALAAALAVPAFAQARHDEKPHATATPAPQRAAQSRPATGGRHDEGLTTHGMPRAKRTASPSVQDATPRQ